MKILVLAAALLSACYNPDLSNVHYTCIPAAEKQCPDGLSCYPDGYCYPNGTILDLSVAPRRDDAGLPIQEDMSSSGSPDMQWGVYGPAPGCKTGLGYPISASASACPGKFTSDPTAQCINGWVICGTNPLPAAQCQAQKPFGVAAFFIGAARGKSTMQTNPTSASCGWAGADASDYRYLFGCGAAYRWNTLSPGCSGYGNLTLCGTTDPNYTFHCPMSIPGLESDWLQVSNQDVNSGVFCCKP